jgi:hypothetical protein
MSLIADGIQERFFKPFLLLRRLNLIFVQPFADLDADLLTRKRHALDVRKFSFVIGLVPFGEIRSLANSGEISGNAATSAFSCSRFRLMGVHDPVAAAGEQATVVPRASLDVPISTLIPMIDVSHTKGLDDSKQPGVLSQTRTRSGGLSTRMLLPIFRAVAQLIFELLLRPVVVEHAVHPATTRRIRLAAEHVLVRGSHDGLRLVSCHLSIRSI